MVVGAVVGTLDGAPVGMLVGRGDGTVLGCGRRARSMSLQSPVWQSTSSMHCLNTAQ